MNDFRYALRQILRQPGFTILAVVALALAFTLAPAVLAIAALLATWLPARRATRISPMAALRTE